jgi:hypothetical protein
VVFCWRAGRSLVVGTVRVPFTSYNAGPLAYRARKETARKFLPSIFVDHLCERPAGRLPTTGRRVQEVAFLGKAKLLPGMDSRTGVAYTIIVSSASRLTHAGTSPRAKIKTC